jgi:hypothetical protein
MLSRLAHQDKSLNWTSLRDQNFACEKFAVKCGGSMTRARVCVCVCSKIVFLTLPHQVKTPQILKLEFPTQTWGPKQKYK